MLPLQEEGVRLSHPPTELLTKLPRHWPRPLRHQEVMPHWLTAGEALIRSDEPPQASGEGGAGWPQGPPLINILWDGDCYGGRVAKHSRVGI